VALSVLRVVLSQPIQKASVFCRLSKIKAAKIRQLASPCPSGRMYQFENSQILMKFDTREFC
jgi:hypothetical protein